MKSMSSKRPRLSLTTPSRCNMSLVGLSVSVRVVGLLAAETSLTTTWLPQQQAHQEPAGEQAEAEGEGEGTLRVPLPATGTVCGYSVTDARDGATWEAAVVDAEEAREAYEEEHRAGGEGAAVSANVAASNVYECKVFPIIAALPTKISVRYTQQLRFERTTNSALYALPFDLSEHKDLQSLEMSTRVDCILDCSTNSEIIPIVNPASVNSPLRFIHRGSWTEASVKISPMDLPAAVTENCLDFSVSSIPQCILAVEWSRPLLSMGDNDYFFMCACTAVPTALKSNNSSNNQELTRIGILWDTSYSRVQASHSSELDLVKNLALQYVAQLDLFRFDIEVRHVASDVQPENLADLISSLTYSGATDLNQVATWCRSKSPEYSSWILFSDGVDTLPVSGNDENLSFGAVTHCLCDCSATEQYSDLILRKIAHQNNGRYLDLSNCTAADAVECLTGRMANPKIILQGVSAQALQSEVSHCTPHVIYGRFDEYATPGTLQVDFSPCGIDQRVAFSLPSQSMYNEDQFGIVLGRRWAMLKIEQLRQTKSELLKDVCKQYNLCAPECSFIVLRTLEQFLKHHIPPPPSMPFVRAEYWRTTNLRANQEQQRNEKLNTQSKTVAATLWKHFCKWLSNEYDGRAKQPQLLYFHSDLVSREELLIPSTDFNEPPNKISRIIPSSVVEGQPPLPMSSSPQGYPFQFAALPMEVPKAPPTLTKYFPPDFAPAQIPRRVKDKALPPIQITAESILRESKGLGESRTSDYSGSIFQFDLADTAEASSPPKETQMTRERDSGEYKPYGYSGRGYKFDFADGSDVGPPQERSLPSNAEVLCMLSDTTEAYHPPTIMPAPSSRWASQTPPPGYKASLGRGAVGFTTRSDALLARYSQDIDDRPVFTPQPQRLPIQENFLSKKSWHTASLHQAEKFFLAHERSREQITPPPEVQPKSRRRGGKRSRCNTVSPPRGTVGNSTSTGSDIQTCLLPIDESYCQVTSAPRISSAHICSLNLQSFAAKRTDIFGDELSQMPLKRRSLDDDVTPGYAGNVPEQNGRMEIESPFGRKVVAYRLTSATQCAPSCSNLLSRQGTQDISSLLRMYPNLYNYVIQIGQPIYAFIIGSALYLSSLGQWEAACRVLSNIAEHFPGEVQPLCALGTVFQALGMWTQAHKAWRASSSLRKLQPQYSYHAAITCMRMQESRNDRSSGAVAEAVSVLQSMASGETRCKPANLGLQVSAKLDLICHTASSNPSIPSQSYDQEGLSSVPELDFRVIMWAHCEDYDVEMKVTEPSGECCSMWHNHTAIGGRMSGGSSVGMGPWEYTLKTAQAGSYRVQARVRDMGRKKVTGSAPVVVVGCRCVVNFGRTTEKEFSHFGVLVEDSSALLFTLDVRNQ
ncbi:hypothetical protein Pelo_6792 [Pelomyxa schiedti]|nr:hypothetical protein Pelo_6792 [Pelomyxa schiedti]